MQQAFLRGSLVIFVLVAAIGFGSGVAQAHSDLASSSPQDGETVLEPIAAIELVFASPIDFDKSSFEVVDEVGAAVPIASTSIADDDITVTISLDGEIYQGAVGVGYTIVANDSHPRSGSITFGVDAPPPTPTPVPTAAPKPTQVAAPTETSSAQPSVEPSVAPTTEPTTEPAPEPVADDTQPGLVAAPSPDRGDAAREALPDLSEFLGPPASLGRMVDAQAVARGFGFGAGVLLIGGLLFFARIAGTEAAGISRRLLQVAAGLTVVSGIVLVALQAGISDSGDVGALMNPVDWARELRGAFGVGVALRIVGGVLGFVVAGSGGLVLVGVAVTTALSFPLLGHGASRDPLWLVFPADLVHVVVVSVWSGGLLMLVIGLARGVTSNDIVERFSFAAGLAVAAAAVTGVVLAGTELDSFGALSSTTYGKRLVLKTLLVAGIVGLGAVHRFRLLPALRRETASAESRRKIVTVGAVEVVAMAAVIVVTALLVNAAT